MNDALAEAIYDALGEELRFYDWKPWADLSFEIKDRYRRIAKRVERAIGDDPSRQARPTTDDRIVAESP